MKDPRIEQRLRSEGVNWEYLPEIPLARIDIEASLRNQARLRGPLNGEVVAAYVVAQENGDSFPAIVAHNRKADGKALILDGNHRVAASLKTKRTVDAYVVQTDDAYVIERLTRSLNTIEGQRPSPAEIMEQAKAVVRKHNRTIKDVATSFGVSEYALSEALRQDEGASRLRAMGVKPAEFTKTALIALNAVPDNAAMRGMAVLASEARLTSPEIQEHVTALRRKRSTLAQLEYIKNLAVSPDIQRRIAEKGRGKARRSITPRSQILRHLTCLQRLFNDGATAHSLGIADATSLKQMREAVAQMHDLATKVLYDAQAV